MQPKAVPHREQSPADQHLGHCVLDLVAGYHLAALGGADDIGHGGLRRSKSRFSRRGWTVRPWIHCHPLRRDVATPSDGYPRKVVALSESLVLRGSAVFQSKS